MTTCPCRREPRQRRVVRRPGQHRRLARRPDPGAGGPGDAGGHGRPGRHHPVGPREQQTGGSGGSLEPPGPLLEAPGPLPTHLHTVYIAYSERLPTRLKPLAERTCFSQVGPRRGRAHPARGRGRHRRVLLRGQPGLGAGARRRRGGAGVIPDCHAARLQYSSNTPYQVSYHIQWLFPKVTVGYYPRWRTASACARSRRTSAC